MLERVTEDAAERMLIWSKEWRWFDEVSLVDEELCVAWSYVPKTSLGIGFRLLSRTGNMCERGFKFDWFEEECGGGRGPVGYDGEGIAEGSHAGYW